ncbi:Maf family protein [Corynebacterium pacaense]|uniref:Maf family protein n=1 Tax=Corynebacterium pacaense TaxID=1816684 RepID=UPI0009BC2DC6|nr:nucleoside triphosphate pyrophosphatase [Corynebacterium pacaense]
MRLVLASASPSRRMILNSAGVDPVIHPAEIDEEALQTELADAPPERVVTALAETKAAQVAPLYPGDIIIGGDSMLLLDGRLQGKPHTVAATIDRWRAQRGRTAELLTGHAIIWGSQRLVSASRTRIRFAEVSDADIESYANSGEPLECAGAFTLEALGGWFIDSIDGDPSSVIGLSLPVVRRAIYGFGMDVADLWNR